MLLAVGGTVILTLLLPIFIYLALMHVSNRQYASNPTTNTITVTNQPIGTLQTQLSTNEFQSGIIDVVPGAKAKLIAYAPPYFRIHLGTDEWNGPLPEAFTQGSWDFGPLNELINDVKSYNGTPLLNVRYAPNWMWSCSAPF